MEAYGKIWKSGGKIKMEDEKPTIDKKESEVNPTEDLLFEKGLHEISIEINGTPYHFTIQGLTQYEVEEIGSEAREDVQFDQETGAVKAKINQGLFYHKILMRGIVRAPHGLKWTDENVKRLKSEAREILLAEIMKYSDGMDAFKKKSEQS